MAFKPITSLPSVLALEECNGQLNNERIWNVVNVCTVLLDTNFGLSLFMNIIRDMWIVTIDCLICSKGHMYLLLLTVARSSSGRGCAGPCNACLLCPRCPQRSSGSTAASARWVILKLMAPQCLKFSILAMNLH